MHDIYRYLFGIGSNGIIDRAVAWTAAAAFWTAVSAIATLLILWLAWVQLRAMNKTSKASFANDFTKDFFNPKTRLLTMLFNYELLKFRTQETGKHKESNKEYAYFELDRETLSKAIKIDDEDKKELKNIYSAFEIDDALLGFFEDIGNYVEKELLDDKMVYDSFDWYIGEIGSNEEVIKYINWQRSDGGDIYSGFEGIYRKLYPDRPKWDTYKK